MYGTHRASPGVPRAGSCSAGEGDLQLATLARAVGHPARVRILRLLARCDACLCGDIVQDSALAQSTVSQHLKKLKESGLVRGTIDGPRVSYGIDRSVLERFKHLVADL